MSLNLITNLQHLGFTENEAKIYTVLIGLNQAKVSEISRAAGVPRAKSYGILRNMEKKGYVHILEGGRSYFAAPDPRK